MLLGLFLLNDLLCCTPESQLVALSVRTKEPLQFRPATIRSILSTSTFSAGSRLREPIPSYAGPRLEAVTDLVPSPGSQAISPYATAQSIRVSADVLAGDDPASALAARFLLRHPEGTRNVYRTDLQEWFAFCDRLGVSVLEARLDHGDAYARYLAEAPRRKNRPLARATQHRKLSAVSSFYRYAVSVRVLSESPFLGIARPKVSEDSPTTGLTRKEVRRLVAAAEDDGPRSAALITLLATNGLRITEAISRNIEHLTYDQGHRVLLLERKGGKRAKAPLSPAVVRALDAYLGDRTIGPLFTTASGKPMDRIAGWRLVRRIARKAGIAAADRISPHSARHAFATGALDAGASMRDVQDAMGHADPRTTRRYDRARHNLDRHPTYTFAAWLADTADEET